MLVKYVDSQREAWSSYLATCVFAYNTSRHDSTKMTPFEVMFGRKATLPIDIELRKKSPAEVHDYAECDESDYNDRVKELEEQRRERLELVKANIDVAQKKQKENYDRKRAMPQYYKVGALVLLKDHTRKKRKGGKLAARWHGPFTIHRVLQRGMYALSDTAGRIRRVTGTHIKVYRQPDTQHYFTQSTGTELFKGTSIAADVDSVPQTPSQLSSPRSLIPLENGTNKV